MVEVLLSGYRVPFSITSYLCLGNLQLVVCEGSATSGRSGQNAGERHFIEG